MVQHSKLAGHNRYLAYCKQRDFPELCCSITASNVFHNFLSPGFLKDKYFFSAHDNSRTTDNFRTNSGQIQCLTIIEFDQT